MAQQFEQWAAGRDPDLIGTHAKRWARYPNVPALYDPSANGGLELTQIPPLADVGVRWQCTSGHTWTGTPRVMVMAAGWKRGRQHACPKCVSGTVKRGIDIRYACGHDQIARGVDDISPANRCPLCVYLDENEVTREQMTARVVETQRAAYTAEADLWARHTWVCPVGHRPFVRSTREMLTGYECRACWHETQQTPPADGEAFADTGLSLPTSEAEALLFEHLSTIIRTQTEATAIRVRQRVHGRLEVWPDIIFPALRIAVEYDDPGRDGDYHRGDRELADLEKDAALRDVGWEIIRVRVKGLRLIGPHDIAAPGVSMRLARAVVEMMAVIRGRDAVDPELVDGSPT